MQIMSKGLTVGFVMQTDGFAQPRTGFYDTLGALGFPYERCPTRASLIRNIGLVVVTQTDALSALCTRGERGTLRG